MRYSSHTRTSFLLLWSGPSRGRTRQDISSQSANSRLPPGDRRTARSKTEARREAHKGPRFGLASCYTPPPHCTRQRRHPSSALPPLLVMDTLTLFAWQVFDRPCARFPTLTGDRLRNDCSQIAFPTCGQKMRFVRPPPRRSLIPLTRKSLIANSVCPLHQAKGPPACGCHPLCNLFRVPLFICSPAAAQGQPPVHCVAERDTALNGRNARRLGASSCGPERPSASLGRSALAFPL